MALKNVRTPATSNLGLTAASRTNLPNGDWTVGGWCKTSNDSGFMFGAPVLAIGIWQVTMVHAAISFLMYSDASEFVSISTTPTPYYFANQWKHIIFMRSGGFIQLWWDGSLWQNQAHTLTAGCSAPASPMTFGCPSSDSTGRETFHAEHAKWNVALSTDQVASLHAGVRPSEIGPKPEWYLPFSENMTEVMADLPVTTLRDPTIVEHHPSIVPAGDIRSLYLPSAYVPPEPAPVTTSQAASSLLLYS